MNDSCSALHISSLSSRNAVKMPTNSDKPQGKSQPLLSFWKLRGHGTPSQFQVVKTVLESQSLWLQGTGPWRRRLASLLGVEGGVISLLVHRQGFRKQVYKTKILEESSLWKVFKVLIPVSSYLIFLGKKVLLVQVDYIFWAWIFVFLSYSPFQVLSVLIFLEVTTILMGTEGVEWGWLF